MKNFKEVLLSFNMFFASVGKQIFSIALILSIFVISAFASPPLASKQQIGMFKNSTTCVVLESGSIAYNAYIKSAVEKYWKSTDFLFIDQEEFETKRFDSKYSFLVLLKGLFDKDPGGVSYSFLSLVMGGQVNDITNMPELCSIPLSYADDNSMSYGYAIPSIIKFMQKHAYNLEQNRFIISLSGLKYYNNKMRFKDKVLLLNKDAMASDANSVSRINEVYPYYVSLLTTSEIETALASNPIKTLFVFHVGPMRNSGSGKCFDMIFDVEGNMYYYSYRKITNENEDGFNLSNFRQLR
jgi:hypothetical protein